MISCKKRLDAIGNASQLAEENSKLCLRAYNNELVELQEVIEAQLVESLLKAVYDKTLYDHCEAQFHMDFVVGTKINEVRESK